MSGAGDSVLRVVMEERAFTCPVTILIFKTRMYLEYLLHQGEETLNPLGEWCEPTFLEECLSS